MSYYKFGETVIFNAEEIKTVNKQDAINNFGTIVSSAGIGMYLVYSKLNNVAGIGEVYFLDRPRTQKYYKIYFKKLYLVIDL